MIKFNFFSVIMLSLLSRSTEGVLERAKGLILKNKKIALFFDVHNQEIHEELHFFLMYITKKFMKNGRNKN
jgi:hypothetical protein